MTRLTLLDSLTIDVLVDNTTDSYSSKPHNVISEFSNVLNAGAQELSGATLCCAQLGFSVMLSAISGTVKHKLLFDAGPEGPLFVRNCKNLGVSDPFLLDERYLAVQIKDKGLVVFSSCSHAGIINVLLDVQKRFEGPLYCVFGGLHLVAALEQIIPATVESLKQFAPAHSSGTLHRLARAKCAD